MIHDNQSVDGYSTVEDNPWFESVPDGYSTVEDNPWADCWEGLGARAFILMTSSPLYRSLYVPPTVSSQLAALSAAQNSGSDDDDYMGKRRTSAAFSRSLPRSIHIPQKKRKKQIAVQTNLTLLQVNNWFINARRRILQPMLDSSNPEQAKTKKSKPQNRPLQRFWPESIANIQPQLPTVLSTTASPLSQGEATASNKQSSGEQVLTITVTSGGAIMTSSDAVKLESMSTMLGHANSQSMSDMLSRQQDEDNSDIGLDHSDSSLSEQ
ncbi:hypothetical protein ScPMuIL_002959 [Solemya velum]